MKTFVAVALAMMGAQAGQAVPPAPATAPVATPVLAPAFEVEDAGPGTYRVNWGAWNADAPMDLYVADKAYAPPTERMKIAPGASYAAIVALPGFAGRPYFYLQPAKGEGRWLAQRVLPLEGGRNFRDLGGYRTSDGHSVRWGKVFRSGSMAGLTPADYEYLGRLGIRSVCDFRTAGERKSDPNKWVETARINYWTRDYDMSGGDLAKLFTGKATAEQARASMAEMYRELPYEQAPAYKEMFRKMVAGELPLAFNCSAGKDRAGLAAALVLTALGVPRETVFADYELSNRYLRSALARDKASDHMLSNLPKDIIGPLLAADPLYIKTAFDEMIRRDGSPEAYLRNIVGLTEQDQASLKRALLE